MAQVMLDRLHVLAVVGPLIAGGMVQYVRVDRELDVGVATGPLDPLADGVGCQRRLTLADEHVGRLRVSRCKRCKARSKGWTDAMPCFRRVT